MYRASTPTHTFCFGIVNPENFKEILISYSQNNQIILEKKKQDLVITSEDIEKEGQTETHYLGTLKLTQEETKLFSITRENIVTIQVRALDYFGNAPVSKLMKVPLLDVQNDEVLS